METVDDIRRACTEFLVAYFGAEGEPGMSEGLRLVCLGNPEKTVQGELLTFLHEKCRNWHWHVVSECGASDVGGGNRLNPDLTVFDSDWCPVCVIELKHYSANQGTLAGLLQGLLNDKVKFAESLLSEIPLIQIGLFTEIRERAEVGQNNGLYRFLRTYFDGPPPVGNFNFNVNEICLTRPRLSTLSVGECSVTGRVGYTVWG